MRDRSLETLLDLDGQVLVVDPEGQYWVRFVVQSILATEAKPHGLDYSLTLHGPDGERLIGFDNAHLVRGVSAVGRKMRVAFAHRHTMNSIRPYEYQDAATLLEDFWGAVDQMLRQRGVIR